MASIERLLQAVEGSPYWQAAVIVGSLASGHGDAMSDVDALILVEPGAFQIAWEHRHELHADPIVTCWDTGADRVAYAGHKWLTWDLTYMDCAVAEPAAVRLAGPFILGAGYQDLLAGVDKRPIAEKKERAWRAEGAKPIAVAYADLKDAVRSTFSRD